MSTPSPQTEPAAPAPLSGWRRWKHAYDSRPLVRWAFDLGLLFLIFVSVGVWQTRAHVRGGPIPAVTLKTLDGQTVSLDSLKGKPTLLAFWAPWCTVCETESRNLGWARSLVGGRANVISVATSWEQPSQVTAYTQRNGVDYPVLLDDSGLAESLNISSFPTVYFVDAQGHIKGSVVGYTTTFGLVLRTLF